MNRLECCDCESETFNNGRSEACVCVLDIIGRAGHALRPDPTGDLGTGAGDCHGSSLGHCPLKLDLAAVEGFTPRYDPLSPSKMGTATICDPVTAAWAAGWAMAGSGRSKKTSLSVVV